MPFDARADLDSKFGSESKRPTWHEKEKEGNVINRKAEVMELGRDLRINIKFILIQYFV